MTKRKAVCDEFTVTVIRSTQVSVYFNDPQRGKTRNISLHVGTDTKPQAGDQIDVCFFKGKYYFLGGASSA